MTERRRYIKLAKEFEATSAQIARCVRVEIDALLQRGVTVSESLHAVADSLDQIPRQVAQLIRDAEGGGDLDLSALQQSQERYCASVARMLKGIDANLRVN